MNSDGVRLAADPGSFYTSKLVRWWMVYDEEKVKPFLIRNYDRLRAIVEDKYQEQMETNFATDDVAEIAAKVDQLRNT
jgi:predicted choloylglycine hydrolase